MNNNNNNNNEYEVQQFIVSADMFDSDNQQKILTTAEILGILQTPDIPIQIYNYYNVFMWNPNMNDPEIYDIIHKTDRLLSPDLCLMLYRNDAFDFQKFMLHAKEITSQHAFCVDLFDKYPKGWPMDWIIKYIEPLLGFKILNRPRIQSTLAIYPKFHRIEDYYTYSELKYFVTYLYQQILPKYKDSYKQNWDMIVNNVNISVNLFLYYQIRMGLYVTKMQKIYMHNKYHPESKTAKKIISSLYSIPDLYE
jgi:hypothetical protein